MLRHAAEVAALPEPPRDVLEAVLALARERHRHDRLAELVEVVPGAVRLDVRAGHLRDRVLRVVRLVAEEVEVRAARREVRRARLLLGGGARDDDRALRDAEHLAALGHLRVLPREELLARADRPFEHAAVLGEEVVGGRALRRRAAPAAQELEERIGRDGALSADGRAGQVLLEVEELELGRLPDQLGGLLGVGDAGELDDDLVAALLAKLGLRDAELVDAVPHDVDGAIEVVVGQLVTLGGTALSTTSRPP